MKGRARGSLVLDAAAHIWTISARVTDGLPPPSSDKPAIQRAFYQIKAAAPQQVVPVINSPAVSVMKGARGTAGSSRHTEIYEPSGGGPERRDASGPSSAAISSGCWGLLEAPSHSSLFGSTHEQTLVLTCLASFELQGSILTFDPGVKAEMARQRSC